MDLSLAEILPHLSERGRVEFDLATARAQVTRQQRIITGMQGTIDQLAAGVADKDPCGCADKEPHEGGMPPSAAPTS